MNPTGLAFFETAIGPCGIAWNDAGIVSVQLPETSADATLARLSRRVRNPVVAAPTPAAEDAIDGIIALLRGQAHDLTHIPLDMGSLPAFHCRVYEITRGIKPGTTRTYGEIARQLGKPGASRAVGQALGQNPFAIIVPCHRVLAAGGKPGGFSAAGGVTTKLRMLAIEGARPVAARGLFDAME